MTRRLVLRGLALLVTAARVGWMGVDEGGRGVGARGARIAPATLAGVGLLFATSYALRGARIFGEFRDELGAENAAALGYVRVLRLTLVHNALVNVLPFRSGEAAFPVLLSRWFGVATDRAVVSLLWLRAQDACVVLALAALAWPGLATGWRAAALAALVVGAVVIPRWARRHRVGATGRVARLGALLDRAMRRSAAGWAWTVANWIVKLVAETWLLARALGTADGNGAAVLGAIGAELAAILPVQGIAGFGTFEAGSAGLMRTADVPLAAGLEAALVLHAVVLALSLAAGGVAAAALPGVPRDASGTMARPTDADR